LSTVPKRDALPDVVKAAGRDGAPSSPAASPPAAAGPGRRFAPEDEAGCEVCGHPSLDRHCKIVCPKCGAIRDCSDP
jgi:hypothetical protein